METAEPGSSKSAFFSEHTVWVANAEFEIEKGTAISFAIFDRDWRWRHIPTDVLDRAGKTWHVADLSENFASYKAAIRSGLAVGILAQSSVEDDMRVLTKREGFPKLPASSLRLLKSGNASTDIAREMENAILAAIK